MEEGQGSKRGQEWECGSGSYDGGKGQQTAADGTMRACVAGTRAVWDIKGVPGVVVLFFIVVIVIVFVGGWI
jgi:hypothetical protein